MSVYRYWRRPPARRAWIPTVTAAAAPTVRLRTLTGVGT